jgi:hypothetical protein
VSTVAAKGIEIDSARRTSGPRLRFLNGSSAAVAQIGLPVDPMAKFFVQDPTSTNIIAFVTGDPAEPPSPAR